VIEFEWKPGDRLRTRQVREPMLRHPHTKELTWFNHITFFHISTLEPNLREAIMADFDEADYPNNTYYGDGSRIEPEVIEELREAYRQHAYFTRAIDLQRRAPHPLRDVRALHAQFVIFVPFRG
jgi:hypothetical protein